MEKVQQWQGMDAQYSTALQWGCPHSAVGVSAWHKVQEAHPDVACGCAASAGAACRAFSPQLIRSWTSLT